MAYRWNESAGRFTNERGQFVSERAVRGVIDAIADTASARLAESSERLLAGQLSLATWQADAMRTIKTSQLAAITIAHGGAEQMTFSRYGAAGAEIKAQYRYMRDFAAQIESGEQKLNGSLTARARQYGQAARVAFEKAYSADQRQRGFVMCRNILNAKESCSECRALAARGWIPVGEMPPVGSRICRSNCRCRISYETRAAVAA